MRIRNVCRTITGGIVICSLFLMQSIADGAISSLALTGQQAAGLPTGLQYHDFFPAGIRPALNASGEVAFPARLMGTGVTSSNDFGIWMGTPGAVNLVARTGDQAPGMAPGVVFSSLPVSPGVSADGKVVFSSSMSGPGVDATNQNGIWQGRPGDLHLVARSGDPAPGMPPGVIFSSVSFDSWSRILTATLAGPGVTPDIDTGYWLVRDNGMTLIARKGDQVPGTPAGVKNAGSGSFGSDNAGRVAFLTNLTGPGVTADNNVGILFTDAGTTTLIARSGDPAPGAEPGVVYQFDKWAAYGLPQPVVAGGQIAFQFLLSGPGITSLNDTGIWAGPPGNVTLRVRDGQMAAGTGRPFVAVGTQPYFNDAGQIAFGGIFSTGTSSQTGGWLADAGGMRLLAREGQPAPESGGWVYNSVGGGPINAAGQVAIFGGISQGSNSSNGIWIDDGGIQTRVVGGGDILSGRTVGSDLQLPVVAYPSNRIFNDLGQLVFMTLFTDGSSGLFLYNPRLLGDYNNDGIVDAADYTVWRDTLGSAANLAADGNGNGIVDAADYDVWKTNFGRTAGSGAGGATGVPEPATLWLLLAGILMWCCRRRVAVP